MKSINKKYYAFVIPKLFITALILINSTLKFQINSTGLKLFIFTVLACTIMQIVPINVGKLSIDLTDAVTAFIYLSIGTSSAIIFSFINWVIITLIEEYILEKHKDWSKKLGNLSISIIPTYAAASLMGNFKYNSNAVFLCAGFVVTFLIVNIALIKIELSLQDNQYFKLGKEGEKLLYTNLSVSIVLASILCMVYSARGIFGSTLVLLDLIIIHYCFHIYRKLQIESEAVKALLKITNSIVKYGDFREKCKHLVKSLNELIPYTIGAIYTFDMENDNFSYPVAFNSVKPIDIGELGLNLESSAVTIKVIKEEKIYISKDIRKDKRIKIDGKLVNYMEALVLVPIIIEEKSVGVILIGGDQELVKFLSNGVGDLLNILSNQMALAIENDGFYREIKNKAEVDHLTKLYNRRVFDREVDNLITSKIPFSLVMYDLDDFKSINDSYGHLAGDEVLESISDIIIKSVRKTDVPCRYGGEEIAILFKDLCKDDAYIISERIREKIESTSMLSTDGKEIYVTVSGGISEFPVDGITKEEIIGNADRVLYDECKKKGKNRVFTYKESKAI
jgi:diguanylate cyclase (GGDEF)-like protein